MAEDDKIISFRSSAARPRLKKLDWSDKRAQCEHTHIEVWAKEPIIECALCGAVVDPYVWIRSTIGCWDRILERVKWEREAAENELKELKKHLRILRKEYADENEKRRYERAVMIMPPKKQVNIEE